MNLDVKLSVCIITAVLICYGFIIQEVDSKKVKKTTKSKKPTTKPTTTTETTISYDEDGNPITPTTPDWNLLKRSKLAMTRKAKQLIIWPKWMVPRNHTPRLHPKKIKRLRTAYLIPEDGETTTERESKRAKKRRRTTNYSYIKDLLKEFYSGPTKDPWPYTHSNVIVNRRNVVTPDFNDSITGSIIFLHSEGVKPGTMKTWVSAVMPFKFNFKHIRLVFPTSPYQPYGPAFNDLMYVWFDRENLLINSSEITASVDRAAEKLMKIIQYERDLGIPLERIVIGGYGMGGSMALHMAYRYLNNIAGVFALNSFLNFDSAVYDHLAQNRSEKLPPMFFCHGYRDTFIPIRWGYKTFKRLKELGADGKFLKVPHADHLLETVQVQLTYRWLAQILPDKPNKEESVSQSEQDLEYLTQ